MLKVKQRGPVEVEQLVNAENDPGARPPERYRSRLQQTGGDQSTGCKAEAVDGSGKTFVGQGNYNSTEQHSGFDEMPQRNLTGIVHGGGTIAFKVRGDLIGSLWRSDHEKAKEPDAGPQARGASRRLRSTSTRSLPCLINQSDMVV